MSREPILVALSGGYDSAAALWAHITQGERVVTFRLNGRIDSRPLEVEELEKNATHAILRYIMDRFPDQWGHQEIKVGDLRQPFGLIRTANIVAFYRAALAKKWNLTRISCSAYAADLERQEQQHQHCLHRGAPDDLKVYATMLGREPKLEYPIAHMTKQEVIASLPKDLAALCWSCNNPQNGQHCNRCPKCKEREV